MVEVSRSVYLHWLRDLSIHFDDGPLLLKKTDAPENPNASKVLTQNSLKDIIKDINGSINDIKNITDNIKDIMD
ncbi:MAG: hypothetical protein Ta2E_11300 [Mycoplasmoidaceae bacterium]|nr:MAG: hypothetical protein Ta2E_11300 [Mycoplasmoidaceae bacterium]